VMQLKLSDATL